MLEVCVDNFESTVEAVRGGAKRIELCSSLDEGGLTPTIGLLTTVKKYIPSDVLVFGMVRCRRGNDFIYSKEEMEIMVKDAELLVQHGIDGLVFGSLTEHGDINHDDCRRIVKVAKALPCTFHRAFDMTAETNMLQNCKIISQLGFTRILTSGFKPTALEGAENIKTLISQQTDVIIMPGSGITDSNIGKIIELTKCKEFHASVRSAVKSTQLHSMPHISMGRSSDLESRLVCDSEKVRRLLDCAAAKKQ